LRESHSAVIARNERWEGTAATEPYEAGWASEAIVFVRALSLTGGGPATARVQISPDGMHWADEGTYFELPHAPDGVTFARLRDFGNWIRIMAELPEGHAITVLVTISLKE